MNTRYLMIASAFFMAAIGLALTFAPQEILHRFDSDATSWEQTLAQLCGALYCAFALMNWTAKSLLLGGIYGRPIVIGNLVHFTMGALLLLKMSSAPSDEPVRWVLISAYAVFAVVFGYVMMTHPAKASTEN
ncbi:MAG: hypothetical protein IPO90_06870 [Flavobacteriales bacterium]|nr:hypothetical protein [Flavobacteriales bacterium]